MSSAALEIFDEDVSNPLDSVEDILSHNDWVFDRPHLDELSVQITGSGGAYRMTFLWQEEFSALQFYCEYDSAIPRGNMPLAAKMLKTINDTLWLGHFAIPEDTRIPCFRHTSLFRGWTHTSGTEHVEDLMEIAVAECDRYGGVFSLLSHAGTVLDEPTMALAARDSVGEA